LNKVTGEKLWSATVKEDRGAGHSSIVIAEIGKKRVYVQLTASGVMGVDAEDGKLLWTYPIDKTTAVIPTPIIKGDLVFFTAGYDRGGALLKQIPTTDGIKVEEIYGLQKDLANKHGGVVLVGEHLYGDKEDSGHPWCADLMTGKVLWKKAMGSGKQSVSMTYADGHLYMHYADGTMVLAEETQSDYKEVSSFKVPHSGSRPSWAHPVVAGGKLFVREGDFILCYDVRKK
jgi:outer membrane protein assembly factor BamB